MRLLAAPLASYWSFFRAKGNPRFIAFGFLLTLASSFGQTFFISLFSDNIREQFNLTHGGFGLLYSIATFASGVSIIWLGSLIDRIDLRRMTLMVCSGMIVASLLMAVSPHVLVLGLGIYLLRLNGQGLLGHIAATSMARYFHTDRGKAISIAVLGYPTGEAILPTVGVGLVVLVGWRASWLVIAGFLCVTLLPMVVWLLVGHGERHRRHVEEIGMEEDGERAKPQAASGGAVAIRQWTRSEVLRDARFYLVLPAALAPAFIVTGLFFHQVHLVNEKGWLLTWFAATFAGYAASQVLSSLVFGQFIDRYGAQRVFPVFLLPLICGLVVLGLVDLPVAAIVFMALAGLTSGAISPLVGSLWAELYGVKHLGSIRALSTAMMVFSTSASPFLMGWLIDRGVAIDSMALVFAVLAMVASIVAFIGTRLRRPSF